MLLLRVSPISYSPKTKTKLHCFCTATSATQVCKFETPTLQQGFGKNSVLNCITSSPPVLSYSSFIAVHMQYTLGVGVLVCDCLSTGELFSVWCKLFEIQRLIFHVGDPNPEIDTELTVELLCIVVAGNGVRVCHVD